MIEVLFSGYIPNIPEQVELRKDLLKSIEPFIQEFEKRDIHFVLHHKSRNDEVEYNYSIHKEEHNFNFTQRWNHYRKTGEYLPYS